MSRIGLRQGHIRRVVQAFIAYDPSKRDKEVRVEPSYLVEIVADPRRSEAHPEKVIVAFSVMPQIGEVSILWSYDKLVFNQTRLESV